jgi:hypothetical protein
VALTLRQLYSVWKVASTLRDRKGFGKALAQLFPLIWLGIMVRRARVSEYRGLGAPTN